MNHLQHNDQLRAGSHAYRPRPASVASQQGIVLMIALIVLIAMSLAGIALVRSVDTTTAVSGNVSFKQGALQEADRGIEAAIALLETAGALAGAGATDIDNAAYNYYASPRPLDGRGLPDLLVSMKWNDATGVAPVDTKSAATINRVRFLIERLCNDTGSAEADKCSVYYPPPPGAHDWWRPGITGDFVPYYRISVRVDGPKNTLAFSQVIIHL